MSRLAFRLAILLALMVVPTSCQESQASQESQETASNPPTPGLEATSGSFLLERIVRQRPVGSGEAGWKRFGRTATTGRSWRTASPPSATSVGMMASKPLRSPLRRATADLPGQLAVGDRAT